MANRLKPDKANENPGAAATATGADTTLEAGKLQRQDIPKRTSNAMSLFAKRGHKRVAKVVGYALTLGTADAWADASAIFAARLSDRERAGLAWAALRSLDPAHAEDVATALLGGAGQPIAPLFNPMDEAALWADMAAPAELEAYCLACFNAMSRGRKTAFLEYINGRASP